MTSTLQQVPDERDRSPFTGLGRAHWLALADDLLLAVRPFRTPAGIVLPGSARGYGPRANALEGWARTFLAAAFRVAGEGGADPLGHLELYRQGLLTGTDPDHPQRWLGLDEVPQARVEAACLALGLQLTRPWLWDTLGSAEQNRVIDYLAPSVGVRYFENNWVWFQVVTQLFLRSVGGPWSPKDLEAAIATSETFVRPHGWYRDGPGRNYDHYIGWALHFYPLLWEHLDPGTDTLAPHLDAFRSRLAAFLPDALHLIGSDADGHAGAPLFQGRSLAYRFATATPFFMGALSGVGDDVGALRRAANGHLASFLPHGVPDEAGLLSTGWHAACDRVIQSYTTPGSPYWSFKAFVGLLMGPEHPFWTATEQPLPIELGDVARALPAPGWLAHGSCSDGIVRVVNHGTDHGLEGLVTADQPFYARLGYSTATSPTLGTGSRDPRDSTVAVLAADGTHTHRAGFTAGAVSTCEANAVVGSSRWRAHWVDIDPSQRDIGAGLRGSTTPAGVLTVVSVARGSWELRFVDYDDGGPDDLLEVSGWPVVGSDSLVGDDDVTATGQTLRSRLVSLDADVVDRGVRAEAGESPFGADPDSTVVAVPWTTFRPAPRWQVFAVALTRPGTVDPAPTLSLEGSRARVRWPDGEHTGVDLDRCRP